MTKPFAFATLALSLFSLQASATPRIETREDILYCQTQKWSSVSLVKVTGAGYSYYQLALERGSRDRSSGAGAYTDSITPVFWTTAGDASPTWNADGSMVLEAKYSGTQPENTSVTRLVAKPVAGQPGLSVSLEAGAFSNKENYSYEFFSQRFKDLIVTPGDVLEDKSLICNKAL